MNSSQYFPEFVKAKTAAGLMFSMIYRKPKTGDADVGEKIVSQTYNLENCYIQNIRGNILFEDVKFSYPQRPRQPIMKGLQFTATRGQTVALVGPSGSGKSTCISMLERFYDTTGGALVSFKLTRIYQCLSEVRRNGHQEAKPEPSKNSDGIGRSGATSLCWKYQGQHLLRSGRRANGED